MPRIERIRIAGLKYEKMLKKYDDMVLDLSNEEGPANTLITLMNGGGKGVLLQSIFQLLIPKAAWGKDNENQVEAFFHNHKKQLKPYTFHVAIEWRLDNNERTEYMTTGIAMTAHSSVDQLEIKVDYLLYALLEYEEHAELTLSTLPLYDAAAGGPVSFESIQQFVRDRRGEIVSFGSHSSDLKKYYNFLAERDIHIGEWRNMRRINGEEGGIKGYFQKNDAFTNQNLFEKLIIPEIGSSLNEGLPEQEGSLQKMFMDAAIVAQRLPMLEQREKAFAEFTTLAAPLYELVKQGTEADRSFQETELQGRQIYTVIQDELKIAEDERRRKADELVRLHQEARELRFEEDNLKYLRSKEEMDRKQEDFKRVSDNQARARQRLEESKAKEKSLEVAHYLARRKAQIRQIEQWQKEIEAIEGSLEMKERQEVIQAAKEELRKQWEQVFKLWQGQLSMFSRRQQSLTAEEAGLRKERESFLLELGGLDSRINELTSAIRQYTEELGAFASRHGQEAAHSPAASLQRAILAARGFTENISSLQEQRRTAEEDRLSLHKKHTQLSEKLLGQEQQTGELRAKLESQMSKESQLWSQLVVLLEMYEEHNRLGATALFEARSAVQERFIRRLDEAEVQTKRLRRDYYNQLLDVELQHEAYWLPNSDILTVKDTLDSLKISSMLGSAFLNDQPYLIREEELERHPLLPYGLILTEREAAKLQPDLLKELLLKSAVPLFVREQMGQMAVQPFLLPDSQGPLMVLQPDRFLEWKQGIAARLKEQEAELQDTEGYLAKLKSARQEYERLFQGEHTVSLKAKLTAMEALQHELRESLGGLNAEISRNEESIAAIAREMADCEADKAEHEARVLALREWNERTRKQEQDYKDKQTAQDRKSYLSKESASKDQQLAQIKAELESTAREREKWVGDTKYSLFPRLQTWFPELVFPSELQSASDSGTEPAGAALAADVQDLLLQTLSTVESLQQSLSRNELEIRTRAAQIKSAGEQMEELEAAVQQVDSNWRTVPEPEDTPDFIMSAKARQKSDTAILDEDYQHIRDSFIRCQTELEQLQKQLLKAEKSIKEKHERTVELWHEPLDQKAQEIEARSRDNEHLLNACKQAISAMDQWLQTLANQSKIMDTHVEGRVQLRDVPDEVLQQVKEECEPLVADWLLRSKESRSERGEIARKVKEEKNALSGKLAKSGWNAELETKIQDRLNTVHWEDFSIALQVLDSMLQSSRDQIESIRSDKEGMELSRKLWVGRAAKRVVQIVDILRRMERRMIIHNENGYAFPLVRLNYKNISVPKTTDDIEPLVSEYFNRCISSLLEKFPKIEQAPAAAVKDLISDGKIVYAALQNRFPVLQVYKPVTENYFLYAEPEEYHYSDWEVINRGALDEAVGSGGQRQSVQLLVAMMIMTHKRVNRENKGWTVFLYDNPFGEMVSNNVLDPVFEISKALKFQWLIVTPPELVKNDVSVRFGVYWQLYFGGEKGEMLESTLIKGGRKLIPASLF
ncbi:coiled-coil domain-containing protein [Paenibacillus sp. BAC0078]